MSHDHDGTASDRQRELTLIRCAAGDAVRAALRRHMLLGESVAVAGENGEVRILGPDEIRAALDNRE